MSITGNLRTLELAELLQWLAQGTKTGVLMIENEKLEKRIYFDAGKITFSESNNPHEHLGSFLIREGLIDEGTLARAIKLQESTQVLLGKVLVTLGSITESELHDILRRKTEESIFELFSWEEGEFRFIPDETPDQAGIPLRLDVTNVVLEGLRRLDEARHTGQPLVEDHSGRYSLEIEEVLNAELTKRSATEGNGDAGGELTDLPVVGEVSVDEDHSVSSGSTPYQSASSGRAKSRTPLLAAAAAAVIIAVGAGTYLLLMRPDPADGAVARGEEGSRLAVGPAQSDPLAVANSLPAVTGDGAIESPEPEPQADSAPTATDEALRSQYEAELASLRSELQKAKRTAEAEAKLRAEAERAAAPAPLVVSAEQREVDEEPAPPETVVEVTPEAQETAGGDEPPSLSGGLQSLSTFDPTTPPELSDELVELEPDFEIESDLEPQPAPAITPPAATVSLGELVEPGPDVTPPVMLSRPKPTYPQSALRLKKEASVTIRLLVDENGNVVEAERIGPKAGMGFDQAAVGAAKRTRWQPATKDGVQVSMWAELTIEFRP